MIRHVFRLAWQRKKANALLILELLVIFLILFGCAAFALHQLRLYRLPLGFEYRNAWFIEIRTGGPWDPARDGAVSQQLQSVLRQLPQVDAVHIFGDPPFLFGSGSYQSMQRPEFDPDPVMMSEVSDGFLEALGTTLIEGRWFGPEDDGRPGIPVVINRVMRDRFDADTVLGLELGRDAGAMRIVGVFDEFRMDGDFAPVQPLLFARSERGLPRSPSLTLLLKPGATAQFEDELLGVLKDVEPNWDFVINPWAKLRAAHIREYTLPLLLGGITVGFLLVLVGCGMLGVLWQNVIRRMPEMGLRRAVGASAGAVRLQVLCELLAMTCLALAAGFIVVVQLPLSGFWQELDWPLFIRALIASTLLLVAACALFALYPSYQATRREPVDALRYE